MLLCFFFFKQKTAYEMRISDWSSDVCSSDLKQAAGAGGGNIGRHRPAAQGFGPASAEHGPHPLGGALRAVTAAGGHCARPSGDGGGTAASSRPACGRCLASGVGSWTDKLPRQDQVKAGAI